jgi:hypothetical protein
VAKVEEVHLGCVKDFALFLAVSTAEDVVLQELLFFSQS